MFMGDGYLLGMRSMRIFVLLVLYTMPLTLPSFSACADIPTGVATAKQTRLFFGEMAE